MMAHVKRVKISNRQGVRRITIYQHAARGSEAAVLSIVGKPGQVMRDMVDSEDFHQAVKTRNGQ